jgi:hypothetical protein
MINPVTENAPIPVGNGTEILRDFLKFLVGVDAFITYASANGVLEIISRYGFSEDRKDPKYRRWIRLDEPAF